jgi:hypothetical protein
LIFLGAIIKTAHFPFPQIIRMSSAAFIIMMMCIVPYALLCLVVADDALMLIILSVRELQYGIRYCICSIIETEYANQFHTVWKVKADFTTWGLLSLFGEELLRSEQCRYTINASHHCAKNTTVFHFCE